jgi:hypothetical protein
MAVFKLWLSLSREAELQDFGVVAAVMMRCVVSAANKRSRNHCYGGKISNYYTGRLQALAFFIP